MSDLQQTSGQESFNKIKELEKKLYKCQQNLKEATDNIVILENTLENKNSEIDFLQINLKTIEEVSSCDSCDKSKKEEKELKKHDFVEHVEEDLPTTSKCGTYDYSRITVKMKTI